MYCSLSYYIPQAISLICNALKITNVRPASNPGGVTDPIRCTHDKRDNSIIAKITACFVVKNPWYLGAIITDPVRALKSSINIDSEGLAIPEPVQFLNSR
jgi:hypothetical protein